MKLISKIALAVSLVIAIAAIGYFGYQKWQRAKQAEVACVATLFPYFLIEHNQNAIVNALRDMQKETTSEAPSKKSQPFLSENIEKRLSEISEQLRADDEQTSEGKDPEPKKEPHLAEDFEGLVSLFRAEAPAYLSECVGLFSQIYDRCGIIAGGNDETQKCFESFQNEIQDMVSHYTNLPPAKR